MISELHDQGVNRLELLKSLTSQQDFETKWPENKAAYSFKWGDCWKSTVTLRVPDFPAEFAFFLDVLGFRLFAHWENHAMVASPDSESIITLGQAENADSYDPSLLQIDFMLSNLEEVSNALKERGVELIVDNEPEAEGSPMFITTFTTPNGILVKLWTFNMPETE